MPKAKQPSTTARPGKQRRPPLVTIPQMAAMNFEAWPAAAQALGSFPEWMERAESVYPGLRMGLGALAFDSAQLTDRTRAAGMPDTILELAEFLHTQSVAFRGLSKILETANVRLMGVMARLAIEEQAAEVAQ